MRIIMLSFLLLCSTLSMAENFAYVHGKIIEGGKGSVVTTFYSNLSLLEKANLVHEINESGEFEAPFLIHEPQVVQLQYNSQRIFAYLEPGDNLGLLIQGKANDLRVDFFEKNQKNNNSIYQQYISTFGYWKSSVRIPPSLDLPHGLYKSLKSSNTKDKFLLLKERHEKEEKFFQQIKAEEVSEGFYTYLKNEIQYRFLSYLVAFVPYEDLEPSFQTQYDSFLQKIKTVESFEEQSIFYKVYLDVYALANYKKEVNKEIDYYEDFPELYSYVKSSTQLKAIEKEQLLGRILYLNTTPGQANKLAMLVQDYNKLAKDNERLEKINERFELAYSLQGGQKMPDFELENFKGQRVSLSDFKGKKVYMIFWAKWCGACKVEIKEAEANREKLKNANIAFVFISIDDKKETWQNHSITNTQHGIHLWGGAIKDELMEKFGIISLPRNFLVDANGNYITGFPKSSSDEFIPFIEKLAAKQN